MTASCCAKWRIIIAHAEKMQVARPASGSSRTSAADCLVQPGRRRGRRRRPRRAYRPVPAPTGCRMNCQRSPSGWLADSVKVLLVAVRSSASCLICEGVNSVCSVGRSGADWPDQRIAEQQQRTAAMVRIEAEDPVTRHALRLPISGRGVELLKRNIVVDRAASRERPGIGIARLKAERAALGQTGVRLIEEVAIEHPRLAVGSELRAQRAEFLLRARSASSWCRPGIRPLH